MAETNIQNVPTLKKLCDTLVDTCDATYIAAAEQTLSLASPVIFYHVPGGQDEERPTCEILEDRFDGVGFVRHKATKMRVELRYVGYEDIHTFGRVPLYAEGQLGIKDRSLREGLDTADRYLVGDVEVTRPPSDTIELKRLVERFAAEGAAAVELRNTSLTEWDIVDLRVPMAPAVGHDVVGPFTHVTVGGTKYRLRVDFTLHGPGSYGMMCSPLYVSEDVSGLAPVAPDEGMRYFAQVQAIATAVEDDATAHRELRELEFESCSK